MRMLTARFAPILTVFLLGIAHVAAKVPWNLEDVPAPPDPECIEITDLPLPPAIASNATCQSDAGCIEIKGNVLQAGSFTMDQNHVLVSVNFVGSPGTIYTGTQLIIIKADNTTFPSGHPWKCITCGVPAQNQVGRSSTLDYPNAFRDGKRILAGSNIIDTGELDVADDRVNPNNTFIYPIRWNTTPDGSGNGGSMRELRHHPDGVHLAWSSFTSTSQFAYYGRLEFNPDPKTGLPLAPRYDLTHVQILINDELSKYVASEGSELVINYDAIAVGELRGFSGSGNEITYLGAPWESCNIDVFAVSLYNTSVRRLTEHPEYVDPIDVSADDEWIVVQDTRFTNRQMWLAGMRYIPPIVDLVATTATSSTRNNGERRFFQPWLIDRYGDRGDYFGQQVNGAGDGSDGAINDPNWNGKADPHFSLDGTRIVYYQDLVVAPACGGANPLPCPKSTYPDGRLQRVMVANLVDREPYPIPIVKEAPDIIPWATPYTPGNPTPERRLVEPGNYTYHGQACGVAKVQIEPATTGGSGYKSVSVSYDNYSDDDEHFINGWENVTVTSTNFVNVHVDWYSDIVQSGAVNGTKKTSNDGFHLQINILENIFNATGTLTTTLDGVVYTQPLNGA